VRCCRSATAWSPGNSALRHHDQCSLTGTFGHSAQKADLAGTALETLNYPMLETQNEWLVHGFSYFIYLCDPRGDASPRKVIGSADWRMF
jgi:hypothetical protein